MKNIPLTSFTKFLCHFLSNFSTYLEHFLGKKTEGEGETRQKRKEDGLQLGDFVFFVVEVGGVG